MTNAPTLIKFLLSVLCLLAAVSPGFSSEDSKFKSELFKKGKLVYSDDFEGELNRMYWGQPKGKSIKDGKLIIAPLFKSKEEAMKVLKRDHHLERWIRFPKHIEFLRAGDSIVPVTPCIFNCDYQRLEMVASSRHPQSNRRRCLMR